MRISVQDKSTGPQFLDSQDATYEWQWKKVTANATPVALDRVTNVDLAANTVYAFEGLVVARYAGASTGATYRVQGCVKMGAAAANTALVGTPLVTAYEDTAGMDLGITADTTNGRIILTATGVSATEINWLAKLRFIAVGTTV
jgi:hypothetical protein